MEDPRQADTKGNAVYMGRSVMNETIDADAEQELRRQLFPEYRYRQQFTIREVPITARLVRVDVFELAKKGLRERGDAVHRKSV